MPCTEQLRAEHGSVVLALDVLRHLTEGVDGPRAVETADTRELLDFLTGFVDECHAVKEEHALFPAIVEAGAPREGGPVGLMREQHEAGRRHVRTMRDALERYERGDREAATQLKEAAEAYDALLRRHIRYENRVLFPMADAMLSPAAQAGIAREYEAVERDAGAGRSESYRETLSRLHDRYAPVAV